MAPLKFSLAFVVRNFVYNTPAMPKRWSVSVSARPSRTDAAAPEGSVSSEAARRSSCRWASATATAAQASRSTAVTFACR